MADDLDSADVPSSNSGSERRRFLRNAGLAAGAAWAAPTILSATPAAAGLPSPDPCAPAIAENTSTCEPPPGLARFRVAVDEGCPQFSFVPFVSSNGGPFVQLSRCSPNVPAVGFEFPLDVSRQFRVEWFDTCGGNLIQTFDSPVYPACPPPPGAPVGGGAAPGGGTITVTRDDGTTETIPIP